MPCHLQSRRSNFTAKVRIVKVEKYQNPLQTVATCTFQISYLIFFTNFKPCTRQKYTFGKDTMCELLRPLFQRPGPSASSWGRKKALLNLFETLLHSNYLPLKLHNKYYLYYQNNIKYPKTPQISNFFFCIYISFASKS